MRYHADYQDPHVTYVAIAIRLSALIPDGHTAASAIADAAIELAIAYATRSPRATGATDEGTLDDIDSALSAMSEHAIGMGTGTPVDDFDPDDAAGFRVDTAGSWDGHFPMSAGDLSVAIDEIGDDARILVSDRYVGAATASDAAGIAVAAHRELYRDLWISDLPVVVVMVSDRLGNRWSVRLEWRSDAEGYRATAERHANAGRLP